tara:strand:+ start:494 stop:793 length:300 start_codon:yes stop_codon:yes gene_type:complete
MLLIAVLYICAAIIMVVALAMSSKSMRKNNYKSDDEVVTVKQYSEIVIGTMLFLLFYIAYLIVTTGNVDMFDLVYTTIAFSIVLMSGKIVGNWVDYNQD